MNVLTASTAWRLSPAVLVIEVLTILARGQPWLGEWNWTTDWVNGATIVTMPLAAGCAAYDASSLFRSETRALVVSAPRGLLGFTWPAWSTLVVFAGVHLTGLLLGFALNVHAGAGSSPSVVSIPVAFSALTAAVGIGQGLGLALPHLLAAPVAGVVLVAVNVAGAGNVVPQFMRVGGATGSLVGLTWDVRVLLLTATVHLGLAVGLTVGLARLVWPRIDGRRRLLIPGSGLGIAFLGLALLAADSRSRLVPSPHEVALTCRQGIAQVCLAKPTSRKLASLTAALDEQLVALEGASAQVPRTFVQVVPGQSFTVDDSAPLFIESRVLNATSTSAQEAADYALTPTMCPQMVADTPPPAAYFTTRRLLYTWLLVSQGELSPQSVSDREARRWLGLPQAAQAPWIGDAYAKLAACRLGELVMPFAK